MKITLDKLQQIITEEVLKEELAAEIAAPAIAAMLQGTEATVTSDIFGAVFDEMYGEGALEAEAERQAAGEEAEEEDFPTEYQSGGAYGDRPQIGFKESLEEIIKKEFEQVLGEMKGYDPAQEIDAPGQQISAVRGEVGDMSYEIEKMLVSLLKAGYSPDDIINMAAQIKQMDLHPEDIQVAERKLTKSEKKEKEKVVKGMKKSKKDFKKRYGDDAESVMYATATKMAKKKKE